jgi:hypothetical protein
MALIFMGAALMSCVLEKDRTRRGVSTAPSPEIVTAQHNDYTGLEK